MIQRFHKLHLATSLSWS